jgi:hypothetical protein
MTSGYSIAAALKAIQDKDQPVDLLNVFKGVPITIRASIQSTTQDDVVLDARSPESICLALNPSTMIRHAALPNLVKARILEFNAPSGRVRLGSLQFTRAKFVERSQIRVEPRNVVPAELEVDNHKIVGTLADISLIGVGLYISSLEYEFALKRSESVWLNLRLPTGVIRAEGRLRGMGKSVDFCRLAINFCSDTPENAIVQHYVADRQSEILLELRHLYEETALSKESTHPILN